MTNKNSADPLSEAIAIAWNSSKPADMVRLMSREAVWRQGQNVHVGRHEIWTAFEAFWQYRLHYAFTQWVHSVENNIIGVKLLSEWQHSIHGSWFRASGEGSYVIDAGGQVSAMDTQQHEAPISIAERYLSIPDLNQSTLMNQRLINSGVLEVGHE